MEMIKTHKRRWPQGSSIAASIAVALAAATALLAVDGGHMSYQEPAQSVSGQQEAILVQVLNHAREHYPNHYSTASTQPATGALVIYRKPGSDLDEALGHQFPTVDFEFRDARFNDVELKQLAQRVRADIRYWKGQGITIYGVTPRRDGNGVEATTDDPDRARDVLRRRYGEAVTPIKGGPVEFA